MLCLSYLPWELSIRSTWWGGVLPTAHSLESPGNGISVRDYLGQISLWACLGGTDFIILTEISTMGNTIPCIWVLDCVTQGGGWTQISRHAFSSHYVMWPASSSSYLYAFPTRMDYMTWNCKLKWTLSPVSCFWSGNFIAATEMKAKLRPYIRGQPSHGIWWAASAQLTSTARGFRLPTSSCWVNFLFHWMQTWTLNPGRGIFLYFVFFIAISSLSHRQIFSIAGWLWNTAVCLARSGEWTPQLYSALPITLLQLVKRGSGGLF